MRMQVFDTDPHAVITQDAAGLTTCVDVHMREGSRRGLLVAQQHSAAY